MPSQVLRQVGLKDEIVGLPLEVAPAKVHEVVSNEGHLLEDVGPAAHMRCEFRVSPLYSLVEKHVLLGVHEELLGERSGILKEDFVVVELEGDLEDFWLHFKKSCQVRVRKNRELVILT